MKILIILGTRPEAIKMAPLIQAILKDSHFILKICVTAQHREMLDQVLHIFDIKPDYDLNIMKSKQNLTDITCRVLNKVQPVLQSFKPDIVLVHGDTTTTMASTLAAFYQRITVGHIEAGLRTGNIYSPWPEEINRKIVSNIARYHFAPTAYSKKNLQRELIPSNRIFLTGNTIIDSLHWIINKIDNNLKIQKKLSMKYKFINFNKKILLVTGHRRENMYGGFENICYALVKIATLYFNEIQIIYTIHLNPKISHIIRNILSGTKNIFLIKPQNYLSFIYLMYNAYIILTDSGGIQEEATALGKPILVMRDTTERPEAIKIGTTILVGTNTKKIIKSVQELLTNQNKYKKMSSSSEIFGNGQASHLIINALKNIR